MKVFVALNIPVKGIDHMRQAGLDVTVWDQDRPMTPEELIRKVQDFDALLSMGMYKIDNAFLNKCKHLKIISQFSVGYDNIDIAEATRLGIPIGNAPNAMTDATADVAFGLMMAVSRKMFYMHKTIQAGKWGPFKPQANLGKELKNKTLGIFGLGRIGEAVAQRCRGAYQMEVLYCNRSPKPDVAAPLDATLVDFETLLSQSDIISVHCALNSTTRGLFNKTAFDQMKPSAIFINTARGSIHNEPDLIQALRDNTIWGAGLDVTDPEPMKSDNPLLTMENVAILPHIGSATVEARTEMSRLAAENIIQFAKGNKIPNLINVSLQTGK